MAEIDEMVQVALDYIEKESEFWDVEDLMEGGLPHLMLLIQQAVCKIVFIRIHKELEELSKQFPLMRREGLYCFDEECLEEKSIYFYYDCVQEMCLRYGSTEEEKNAEISYDEFYDYFVKFIQYFYNIKVGEDMGEELNQLCQLMQIAFFKDKNNEDILEDVTDGPKLRYVANGRKNIDVQNQTKRFWMKWIVRKNKVTNPTKDQLNSKKMKKEELFFCLIMAAVDNFTGAFGNDKMKNLKKSFAYPRDIENKDISEVLCWCFRCWIALGTHGIIDELGFIDRSGNIHGLATWASKFNYQSFMVKNKLKNELEELLRKPDKAFIDQNASYVLENIKKKSLETKMPLTNEPRLNGSPSTSTGKIVDQLREMFGNFDRKWFVTKKIKVSGKCKNDMSRIEKENFNKNVEVNQFIACEFLKFCKNREQFTNLFLAEENLYFMQLERLMFDESLSGEGMLYYDGNYQSVKDYMSARLFEIEGFLCLFCWKIIDNQKCSIDLYQQLIFKIVERKKIKISDELLDNFRSQRIYSDEFSVNPEGYISWEAYSKSVVEEALWGSIFYAAVESFSDKLEYFIQ